MKKIAKITAVVLVAVMVLTVLVACGYPSDLEKTREQLEKKGYSVSVSEYSNGDVTATVSATKESNGRVMKIRITYYTDADIAKEHYENVKQSLAEEEEYLKEMGIIAGYFLFGNQVVFKSITNSDLVGI